MSLTSGTRIGAYEIIAAIGAGGMGEVYRARDAKLGRDVAIKVLPDALNSSADALARFEREARAVASLSHPNILSIHDFGTADGVSYAVMELLEGESLRQVLASGPLPVRRAVEYAIQIAHGLAAAHDKGVVHRDLKPENVFVTADDRVKILDFGLARQDPIGVQAGGTVAPTINSPTEPGTVLGTVGYMAPEQVRGLSADFRADIFAFGALLYEMLTGVRAFARETAAETMAAILRDDPPEPPTPLPATIDRIVRHCLEKKPETRFRSAHDLAFALDAASGTSTSASSPALTTKLPRDRRGLSTPVVVAAIIAGLAGAIGGFGLERSRHTVAPPAANEPPRFRQLTFNRGFITAARFVPDGRTVVYSAMWNGAEPRLFLTRLEFAGATPISTPSAVLFGVSANAELALGFNPAVVDPNTPSDAALVRMPLLGGAAQRLLDRVTFADWNASGTELAVVRVVGSQQRLEYPVGAVLFETAGEIGHPRVSPDGNSVAFLNWPVRNDDRGTVIIAGLDGTKRTISRTWEALRGLAWSPDGRSVWYSASASGTQYAIWSSRSGPADERLAYAAPGGIILQDIGKDGKALIARFDRTTSVEGSFDGSPVRDLSWLDYSFARDISKDGRRVLFTYSGQGSSANYDVYVRRVDEADATRLGEGQAQQFSPDGESVLAVVHGPPSRLVTLPMGSGEPKTIPTGGVTVMHARWLPGGQQLLIVGAASGRGVRGYVLDIAGPRSGALRPITPERITFVDQIALASDGTRAAFRSPEGVVTIYPVDGAPAIVARGFEAGEMPMAWTADGRSLVTLDTKARVLYAVDPASGRRTTLREIKPSDPALMGPSEVIIANDGRTYVANYGRRQDMLFVVDGLR